jgi:hypothetical protein
MVIDLSWPAFMYFSISFQNINIIFTQKKTLQPCNETRASKLVTYNQNRMGKTLCKSTVFFLFSRYIYICVCVVKKTLCKFTLFFPSFKKKIVQVYRCEEKHFASPSCFTHTVWTCTVSSSQHKHTYMG